jgi:hypothetical protein
MNPVRIEQLQALAAESAPVAPPTPGPAPSSNRYAATGRQLHRLDVDRWLHDRGIDYRRKEGVDASGRTVYLLIHCPFNNAHAGKDAAILQGADGRMGFHCFHDGCAGRTWQDVKKAIGPPDPQHYNPPLPQRSAGRKSRPQPIKPNAAEHLATDDTVEPDGRIRNYRVEHIEQGNRVVAVPVGLSQENIREQLTAIAGDWPKVAGGCLFAEGAKLTPLFLEEPPQLFAWVGRQLPGEADNGILWHGGGTMVSQSRFYEYLRQAGSQYDSVGSAPHFPQMPGCYYMHPALPAPTARHLRTFLEFFCAATPDDRSLLLAFALSLFWGGECGKRPAWLILGPEVDEHGGRGVGKTSFARNCCKLAGGTIDFKDTYETNSRDIDRRLLSPEGRKRRCVLVDNLKALRFSWAYLEALITEDDVSGRQMYVGEGRRPNNLTVIITANGATLSRDMAQRCNVLRLARPAYRAGDWDDEIHAYIDAHRWDIIADVQAMFNSPPGYISRPSRWGSWQRDVLSRVPDAANLQRLLAERATEVDDDEEEMALVRDAIADAIRRHGYDPAAHKIKIKAKQLAEIVNDATGEKRATNKANAYVRQLQIPELRGHTRDKGRFYYWIGEDAEPDSLPHTLDGSPP